MQRITAELTKVENGNFPTQREESSTNGSMLISPNQSLMHYRKSFKGSDKMRQSDCVLNDGNTSNSFNVENRESGGCAKAKKKNNKTPLKLKNSVQQEDTFL